MAGFAHNTSAACFDVLGPVICGKVRRGEAVGEAQRNGAVEEGFQSGSRRGKAAIEANGQNGAFGAQIFDALAYEFEFVFTDAERLLDKNVLTRAESGDHKAGMQIVTC